MTQDEIARRQAAACSVMREPVLFWWIGHHDGCEASHGGDCRCTEIGWFSGATWLVGICEDLSIAQYRFN